MLDGQKILVIIPALNEERKIGEVIAGILPSVHGVIVVDDGSSDRTVEVARQAGA
ncbi:MAG: glycosyltransferase, partial [Bacteroidales bacterium]|nr:glycosyltransferase [Candidatus Latescibacterota bacterium]